MNNTNYVLFDKLISHQIDTIGYSNGVVRKMMALLNKVDVDLMAQLVVAIDKLPPASFTVDRLDQLLRSVKRLNGQSYADAKALLDKELKEFTDYELEYQQGLLESVQPKPLFLVATNAVYAAAMATPFSGKLLKEWMDGLEQGKASLIRDAVRIGFVEGQTTSEIVKRIRGTRALKYSDGLLEITRRNAEAIVLTAVNYTGNFARQALYDRNDDIVKAQMYKATLDTRTSLICSSRDGNIYKNGEPRPAIPAHIRCRSLYVPVLKTFKELGVNIDEFKGGTRATMDKPVDAKITYQDWLKNQSAPRQDEVLGKTKAKLFRDGGLTLDRFISRQGHVYTLQELRLRDAEAFKKANV